MDELSDEQLMAMFQEGAIEGFDVLFAKYHRPVHRFICHVVQDTDQADDLLQDVFLRVRRIVQHDLDAALSARPQAREPSPVHRAEARETMQRLQAGVAGLAERQREAIVLYAMEAMTYREIAQVMDIPINTVKTLIHRARASLAKHLTNGQAPAL